MVEASATAEEKYIVPFEYRKIFSPEQSTELVRSFKNYDTNSDGHMDKTEFKNAVIDMGYRDITDE